MNTAPEIVEGIKSICLRVRSKAPMAKIVLMQIMPRGEMPDNPIRILINETNQILKKFAIENNITLLDITSEMLSSEGVLTKELTFDFCHPTDEGYKIWGEALLPFIDSINY
jgi:lysophospholipase L1-like esterase